MEALKNYYLEKDALFEKIKIYKINKKENTKLKISNSCILNLFDDIDIDKCEEIKQHLVKSFFGSGKKRKFDEEVRKSLETKDIELNVNINLFDRLELYKLVVYEKGCFFDWHLDTHEEDLIGTFIIELKSNHKGGDLILKTKRNELRPFDSKETDSLIGCFFPHDIPHKVEQVTEGYKLSLIFKVKTAKGDLCCDVINNPTFDKDDQEAIELLKNVEFGTNDVVWCTDKNLIKKLIKVNPKARAYEVMSIDQKVEIGTRVYPKSYLDKFEEESFNWEDELPDDIFDKCEIEIKVTDIIINNEDRDVAHYRFHYGYRGNSPCTSNREFEYLNGWIIVNEESNLDDEEEFSALEVSDLESS